MDALSETRRGLVEPPIKGMLWARVIGLLYNHCVRAGSAFPSLHSIYRRFTDYIDMDLSQLFNPTIDTQRGASGTQSQPASAAGSSNHGDVWSRPSSDLPQHGPRDPPISQAPVDSQSSAITGNPPWQVAVGPTSQEWIPIARPVRIREC